MEPNELYEQFWNINVFGNYEDIKKYLEDLDDEIKLRKDWIKYNNKTGSIEEPEDIPILDLKDIYG